MYFYYFLFLFIIFELQLPNTDNALLNYYYSTLEINIKYIPVVYNKIFNYVYNFYLLKTLKNNGAYIRTYIYNVCIHIHGGVLSY